VTRRTRLAVAALVTFAVLLVVAMFVVVTRAVY
jgi:hypothetical protein